MLEKIKLALRIDTDYTDSEIEDLISACKEDMKICGIVNIDDTNTLVIRAVTFYCKAYFGLANKDYDRLVKSYEMLRNHMSLCPEYNTEAVSG